MRRARVCSSSAAAVALQRAPAREQLTARQQLSRLAALTRSRVASDTLQRLPSRTVHWTHEQEDLAHRETSLLARVSSLRSRRHQRGVVLNGGAVGMCLQHGALRRHSHFANPITAGSRIQQFHSNRADDVAPFRLDKRYARCMLVLDCPADHTLSALLYSFTTV